MWWTKQVALAKMEYSQGSFFTTYKSMETFPWKYIHISFPSNQNKYSFQSIIHTYQKKYINYSPNLA